MPVDLSQHESPLERSKRLTDVAKRRSIKFAEMMRSFRSEYEYDKCPE